MTLREHTLSIRLLWPFMRLLGDDPRALDVLVELGQSTRDLADPERRVPCQAALRAVARLVEITGDPQLGLRAGSCWEDELFGVAEQAARETENLGTALEVMVRYAALTSEAGTTWLDVGHTDAAWCYAPRLAHSAAANDFVIGTALGFARRHCRVYGPPKEIWVMHARSHHDHDHEHAYAQAFPADVRFDAPHNAVIMPASALRTPMRGRHPLLAAALDQRAAERLQALHAPVGITQQVRELLAPRLSGRTPDMLEVAHMLGMSSTTLWRRLDDEGTRFTTVLDELRYETALRHLRRPGPSLAEIAVHLGFRDAEAFIKAFRRWSGTTPVRYREGRCAAARVGV